MNVNVGEYICIHYETKEDNAVLKYKDIVNYLSRKFHTNFSMLSKKLHQCFVEQHRLLLFIMNPCKIEHILPYTLVIQKKYKI